MFLYIITKLSKSFSIREFLKFQDFVFEVSISLFKQTLDIQYSSKLQNIQFIIKRIKILFKQEI